MLVELNVRNLAVVAEVSLELGPGLNVLTGETGAGKSLVVDSLGLLAGARASADLIRDGTDLLTVTGVFLCEERQARRRLEGAGVDWEGDELVVRREIARSGRNRVLINHQPVTLKLLAELAPSLIRIHTQREELALVDPELQRGWLDAAGGDEATAVLASAAESWEAFRQLDERWQRATGDERLRLERIDLLRFQASEIDAARLDAGEESSLGEERQMLRHAEAIGAALEAAAAALTEDDGAAGERLHRAARALGEIERWEVRAADWLTELDELRIRVEELGRAVSERLAGVEADPARLDAVEARLAVIERLARKYGGGTAEILERRAEIAEELDGLVVDEATREELHGLRAEALDAYREAAAALTRARREWGERLARGVHAELSDLAMGKARFSVALDRRRQATSAVEIDGEPVEAGPRGVDRVTFELAANPGESPRPLARVASGGELARVYLALQLAAGSGSEADRPAMVFDEVDQGIGGAEADALGRKLHRLAAGGQILAVTHLPQVASYGDRHFRVAKRVVDRRTRMEVEPLDGGGRVREVARMLAGREVTELSLEHAHELIAGASGRR